MSSIELIPIKTPISLKLDVPGSKSITNRIFLLAGLADGVSEIRGALESDDTKYMRMALEKLGIIFKKTEQGFINIQGRGGVFMDQGALNLFLGNAGTAVRFLTVALVLRNGQTIIDGDSQMRQRPIGDLVSALQQLKIDIKSTNDYLPLEINSEGVFPGGEIVMAGNKSSQYFSALLLSAPLARDNVIIKVQGDLVSKPYIDITLRNMHQFGVEVTNNNYQEFIVNPQKYHSQKINIEGDVSAASYFFALAAVTGGEVTVSNVYKDSAQGDIKFLEIIEAMGATVHYNADLTPTVYGAKELKSLRKVNMRNMPDAALTLAVMAAATAGTMTITGLETLPYKETDRLKALTNELRKLGVQVTSGDDYLVITGEVSQEAEIETYNDHRMAMSFAVLGAKYPGIKIKNPQCVEKTYPNFWNDFPIEQKSIF